MRAIGLCVTSVFLLTAANPSVKEEQKEDLVEDAHLDVPGIVTKYGYPIKTYKVETQDGYILTVFRIPYGKHCNENKTRKPPVLVQHGLLSSSMDWLITGPDHGLGYYLADNCHDVWLSNSRGNTYSKEHVSLKPTDSKFWNFSWHEMGVYDIPAVTDYILNVTKQLRIHYIGHSQGTTQFFVMASRRPEYASKFRSAYSLAPVAYMKHLKSPFGRFLSKYNQPLEILAGITQTDEFMPSNEFISELNGNLCEDEHPTLQIMCTNILFLLCGYDSEQLNSTMLPAIVGHAPAGASTRQIIHYGQEIESGHFREYDFGSVGNLKHYGSVHPPDYDLSKINIPIALHFSDNDWLASRQDVNRLANELQHTLIGRYLVPLPKFNHLDFMWATDVRSLVYDHVLNLMKKF